MAFIPLKKLKLAQIDWPVKEIDNPSQPALADFAFLRLMDGSFVPLSSHWVSLV
jgi:hypothetical protein